MERRMKPAPAASFAPFEAYTRLLTAEVLKTRPAARKDVIWKAVSKARTRSLSGPAYRNVIVVLRVRSDCDDDADDNEEHED